MLEGQYNVYDRTWYYNFYITHMDKDNNIDIISVFCASQYIILACISQIYFTVYNGSNNCYIILAIFWINIGAHLEL